VEYVRLVKSLAPPARRYWLDALIAIAAVEGAIEVAIRPDSLLESGTPVWFGAAAIVLVVLPLLGRRRFPFASPASLWLVAALVSFVDGQLVVSTFSAFAAGLVSAFLLGNLRDAAQGRLGLAIALSSAVILVLNDPDHATGNVISTPLLFAIAWLAGLALRERSAEAEAAEERATYAEREREAASRIAVAEERARIARELHDVVAHAVGVMVLQVGAVRHRLPQPLDEDKNALKGVEQTGRTALAEMRQLLGAMRDEREDLELAPQPGLGTLESLVEEVGRAGLPVRLHVDGEPVPLPRALDLSAYRIIQEGLTNTLKHAHASHADVSVRYRPGELRIEVRDDGRSTAKSDGLGHGLVGIRERVKIHGGEMSAGSATDGGFVLEASLPLAGYVP
jgi:signal transduction histidine kinase